MPPLRPPPFRRQLNIDVEEQFILLLAQGKSLRDAFEYIYEFKHHPITTYFPQFFILENVVRDSISLSASKQLTNEKINNLIQRLQYEYEMIVSTVSLITHFSLNENPMNSLLVK